MVQGKKTRRGDSLARQRKAAGPKARRRAAPITRKAAPKKAKLHGDVRVARSERKVTNAITKNIEEIMAARHVHAGGFLRLLPRPKSEQVDLSSAPKHARHRGPQVRRQHGSVSKADKKDRRATKREEMLEKLLGTTE
jgi:hypothetical protein